MSPAMVRAFRRVVPGRLDEVADVFGDAVAAKILADLSDAGLDGAVYDNMDIAAKAVLIGDALDALPVPVRRGELRVVFMVDHGDEQRPPADIFVECENAAGASVNAGEWRNRANGLRELVITRLPPVPRGE